VTERIQRSGEMASRRDRRLASALLTGNRKHRGLSKIQVRTTSVMCGKQRENKAPETTGGVEEVLAENSCRRPQEKFTNTHVGVQQQGACYLTGGLDQKLKYSKSGHIIQKARMNSAIKIPKSIFPLKSRKFTIDPRRSPPSLPLLIGIKFGSLQL
jgi:hypothetical protein